VTSIVNLQNSTRMGHTGPAVPGMFGPILQSGAFRQGVVGAILRRSCLLTLPVTSLVWPSLFLVLASSKL